MSALRSVAQVIRGWVRRLWAYLRGVPTSGRLVFNMGEAFPADDPVAVAVVSISTALNDLITSAKWLVGGDEHKPFQTKLSDAEGLYLLRLSFAQLYEVRESVKHARKEEPVAVFLDGLPDSTKEDLERLITVNTRHDHWILPAMRHIRNQASHYGGGHGWDDLRWAMKQVAGDDDEIEMVNDKVAGMRLRFADHVGHPPKPWRLPL